MQTGVRIVLAAQQPDAGDGSDSMLLNLNSRPASDLERWVDAGGLFARKYEPLYH